MPPARLPLDQMSRAEVMEMLSRFAGLPPPEGHNQDDWDSWLVEAVLIRCKRDKADDSAALAEAIRLLRPLKFFPQLQPHLEERLGRPLTEDDLR